MALPFGVLPDEATLPLEPAFDPPFELPLDGVEVAGAEGKGGSSSASRAGA